MGRDRAKEEGTLMFSLSTAWHTGRPIRIDATLHGNSADGRSRLDGVVPPAVRQADTVSGMTGPGGRCPRPVPNPDSEILKLISRPRLARVSFWYTVDNSPHSRRPRCPASRPGLTSLLPAVGADASDGSLRDAAETPGGRHT
jgi:hypothetical protein